MADRRLSTVIKILTYQVLIIVMTALIFVVVGGWQKALFAALGGGAAFIPNLYFSIWIYKSAGLQAQKIVKSFYVGESGKLLLTAAIFIMIFQLPNIEILPLLVGYVMALSVFWFALLMR